MSDDAISTAPESRRDGARRRYGLLPWLFGFPGLSIRAKAYLAAGGATGLLAVLAFLFLSVLTQQNAVLTDIERAHFPRVQTFSIYFSELSQIHAGMFDLLVTAEDELDEESLFLVSKPKLQSIRDLVERMDIAAGKLGLDQTESAAYEHLSGLMRNYVGDVASAIEMATVDVRLARRHMAEANRSYQAVDTVLSDLVAGSRQRTGVAISASHAAIEFYAVAFGIMLVVVVAGLGLVSWAISRVLVLDLQDITHDMAALATGDTGPLRTPPNRTGELGEMVAALQVFRKNVIEIARVNRELVDRDREISAAKDQAEREKQDALDQLRVALQEQSRREMEEVHAQKLESLGTLAGGVAHEINTPIQFIGNNLDFLRESFEDVLVILEECERLAKSDAPPEAIRPLLEAIDTADAEYLRTEIPDSIAQSRRGTNQVGEIVQAIREYSHPGSKEMSPVDLNKAIGNTVIVSRSQWKNIAALETDFDAALPPVTCRMGELNQVILNLIVNAAQAIEEAGGGMGHIALSTRCDGDWVEIVVSDTGPGIPKANLKKIFEPFFTTKEPGKGTGQGLSIAHAIITRKHGGTLSVQSVVGEGTAFTIRLPVDGGFEKPEAAA